MLGTAGGSPVDGGLSSMSRVTSHVVSQARRQSNDIIRVTRHSRIVGRRLTIESLISVSLQQEIGSDSALTGLVLIQMGSCVLCLDLCTTTTSISCASGKFCTAT